MYPMVIWQVIRLMTCSLRNKFSPKVREMCVQLGLYDVSGKAPSVKFVHIIESGTESPTALDLQDALSLDSLAPSLSTHKESIARAIDLLTPEQSQISEDSLDPFDETTGGSRGFGPALQV